MDAAKQIDFTLNGKVEGQGEAPSYDEAELQDAIAKGTVAWADVPDAVAWVREQRGGGRELGLATDAPVPGDGE